MLQFASDVGISIPNMRLVPLSHISGLPDEAQGLNGQALVIDRFDRPTPNMRAHTETSIKFLGNNRRKNMTISPLPTSRGSSTRQLGMTRWSTLCTDSFLTWEFRTMICT